MLTLPILGAGMALSVWPVLADDTAILTPEHAVTLALSRHPSITTAEAALLRNQSATDRAALPLNSPTLSLQSSVDARRIGASLQQPVSLTGERLAQRRQSTAALTASQAHLRRTRLEVATEVRTAYSDAIVRAGFSTLALASVANAEQLERAVRLKQEEGESSLLDLRLARLSRARTISWLLAARQAETQALQDLAALVGQEVMTTSLGTEPLRAAPRPDTDTIAERSDLRAAQAALEAAELNLTLQRSAALAPLSLGVVLNQEDDELFIGPSMSWSLPLFERNQIGRAEAQGAHAVSSATLRRLTAQAQTELTTTAARHREADDLAASLGGDLFEEAEAALAGITLSYQTGHTDLLSTLLLREEVIEGQVALINLQGQLADARLSLLLATEDDALLSGGAR
jgi:outer membrane protein TolC